MIRFACPGCDATYSVDDSKGGKAGKCPKCQAQFVIPAADAAVGPPPAPEPRRPASPPPADPGAVEIKPCPKCGARLSVAASDLPNEYQRRLLLEEMRRLGSDCVRGSDAERALGSLRSGKRCTLGGLLLEGGDRWRLSPAPIARKRGPQSGSSESSIESD